MIATRPAGPRSGQVLPARWPVIFLAVAALIVAPGALPHGPDSVRASPRPAAYRDQPPIAYVSGGRVFVLDGRGHPAHAVESSTGACCVAWAPDGAHIGFLRGRDLWITRDDGSAMRRVASSVSRWAWSPDGEAIAATTAPVAGRPSRGIDFYAIDLPQVRLTLLRDYHAVDFAWAGLGRRIAVSASPLRVEPGRERAALFMLEVAGPYADCATLCPEPAVPVAVAGPQTRDHPLRLAAWSPHASTLTVWTTNGRGGEPAELALVSPGGGPTVPLAHTPIDRSRIQWSEAGDRLLVLESGREHPSTQTLALCVPPLGCHALGAAGPSAVDPTWSDDGRMAYVAATATERAATTPGASGRDLRLWIADGDGHGASAVARGGVSAPHWLPDARHLVFVRDHQLWLLDTAHGTAMAIAGPLGIRRGPRRDGVSQTDQPTNPRQLFTVSP